MVHTGIHMWGDVRGHIYPGYGKKGVAKEPHEAIVVYKRALLRLQYTTIMAGYKGMRKHDILCQQPL